MLNALLVILAVTIPPANDTRIVDQAGLLTDSQVQELATLFQKVETTNQVKLGLLTLTSLDDEPKAVAVRTLNYWNMSPDSILLLVSTNPKKVFLQPGSNLQYRFTESRSVGLIRDNIVPALKSGRYGAGILNGFHAVAQHLPGPQTVTAPNTPQRSDPAPLRTGVPVTDNDGIGLLGVLLILLALGGTAGLVMYLVTRRRSRGVRYDEVQEVRNATVETSDGTVRIRATDGGVVRNVSVAAPAPNVTVVNSGGGSSNNGFLEGMVVNEMLHSHTPAPTYAPPPAPRYDPPPAPPSPPRHSSRSDDNDSGSSGGGGGGFSWGSDSSSSDSSSSYDSGGGGSSWDSGGGFDSGGGGGGSDW